LSYFIAIEGTDASGKGVGKVFLKEFLEDKLDCDIIMTHEPTKQAIGRFIRSNIKSRTFDSPTEALLFAADRRHHCESLIRPELEKGNIVITERYLYSSLAYQSFQEFSELDWILDINSQALVPDLVIFVYSDIEESMKRIRSSLRGAEGTSEYFEDLEMQKSILSRYRKIFWKFKSKEEKNQFFTPELIGIRNDGSILNYQRKLKRRIIKFFASRGLRDRMVRKTKVRTERFGTYPVAFDFNDRGILHDFLEKTLEYSLRWKMLPGSLPSTLVTRNMVYLIKSLSSYDKVIHRNLKQLHSEMEMTVGYSLESFRRIIGGFKDLGIIRTPDGPRRSSNNYITHMDLTDPSKVVKAKELYLRRVGRYRKKRPTSRKMVLTDYFYQLVAFLDLYKSPVLYTFIVSYVKDPGAVDIEDYIEEFIHHHFNGKKT